MQLLLGMDPTLLLLLPLQAPAQQQQRERLPLTTPLLPAAAAASQAWSHRAHPPCSPQSLLTTPYQPQCCSRQSSGRWQSSCHAAARQVDRQWPAQVVLQARVDSTHQWQQQQQRAQHSSSSSNLGVPEAASL